MIMIEDFCFRMHMRGGFQGDVWACFGRVDGGERFLSTPKAYNPVTKIITTQNNQYQIQSFSGIELDIIQELMEVIENGGYERH